jgi:hypothetical protein
MAKTKTCSNCKEQKLTTQFSNRTASNDGLQAYCKECVNQRNHKKEVVQKRYEYNRDYMKADKDGIIYTITNPIGETYCGSTEKLSNVRFNGHRADYINVYGSLPLLHKSFDRWGIDAHEFKVIENHGCINTNSLRQIESNMIKAYKLNGKSLNVKN